MQISWSRFLRGRFPSQNVDSALNRRCFNVVYADSTSIQRLDVESMLFQRCVSIVYPLGNLLKYRFDTLFTVPKCHFSFISYPFVHSVFVYVFFFLYSVFDLVTALFFFFFFFFVVFFFFCCCCFFVVVFFFSKIQGKLVVKYVPIKTKGTFKRKKNRSAKSVSKDAYAKGYPQHMVS